MRATEPAIHVALIDQNELARAGCRAVFRSDRRFRVVGDGATVAALGAEDLEPDLVVFDAVSAIEPSNPVLAEMLAVFRESTFLLLTDVEDAEFLFSAFESGVRGFLTKSSAPPPVLLNVAYVVAKRGGVVASVTIMEQLWSRSALGRPTTDSSLSAFSGRELEVIELLVEGRTDSEIARSLGLAKTTIQTHVANILNKAQVSNRVQLGVFVSAAGLLSQRPQANSSEAA